MPVEKIERKMSIFELVVEAQRQGIAVALCIVTRSRGSTPRGAASKMIVYQDGRMVGSVGGGELESLVIAAARDALADGGTRYLEYSLAEPSRGDPGVCGGTMEVYVEPVYPEATIVVVGGGHVGKAVVSLAGWLGFRVVLSDDRAEFCTPEMVPGADEYLPVPISALPGRLAITPQTYLLLTTRNVMVDVEGLPELLESAAGFIGIIGSKRRWATTRQKLLEAGISQEKLDRVTSPLGLELNAETPEEIAVSILAEIIMLRRGGDGGRMGA